MTTANFGTTSINGRTTLSPQEIDTFVETLAEQFLNDDKVIFDGSAYEYNTFYRIVHHDRYPAGITSVAPN
jgi:hypothetical protein